MSEAFYIIGIKIYRNKFKGVLGMSQKTYINKVSEKFRMNDYSPSVPFVVKGDRFHINQCPKIILKGNKYRAFYMLLL